MRWRLSPAAGRFVVSDVVIDKISMALTEKRAFTDWLQKKGGSLEGLTRKLKEKIADVDKES
jgi:ABC-type transporter MlaC component